MPVLSSAMSIPFPNLSLILISSLFTYAFVFRDLGTGTLFCKSEVDNYNIRKEKRPVTFSRPCRYLKSAFQCLLILMIVIFHSSAFLFVCLVLIFSYISLMVQKTIDSKDRLCFCHGPELNPFELHISHFAF